MIATPGSTGATSATTPNTITARPSSRSSTLHAVAIFTSYDVDVRLDESQQGLAFASTSRRIAAGHVLNVSICSVAFLRRGRTFHAGGGHAIDQHQRGDAQPGQEHARPIRLGHEAFVGARDDDAVPLGEEP